MTEIAGEGAGPEGAEVGAGGGEAGDITPPESNNWWQFGTKDDAEKWANELVTKRLSRERKAKLDPVLQERDTLKAELEQLRPLKEATQTDSERWESKFNTLQSELQQLRDYRSQSERQNLVRQIADEAGLPSSLLGRVSGEGEDSIREDVQDLLNALSEGGSNPGKRTPPSKAPRPEGGGGGSVAPGGGGSQDSPDDDNLMKSILDEVNQQRRNGGLRAARR